MKSNLDVWAIQHYPDELETALKNINNGISIIYSNIISRLIIANQTLVINFNTVVYNEQSDILIMLMKGSKVSKEDIIKYLENNKKRYVEVTFNPKELYYDVNDSTLPEIWFARESYVLEDAIKDSINKGNMSCTYYPYTFAQLNLGYKDNNKDVIELDGRLCKGIIKFDNVDDKIILLINQKDNVDKFNRDRNVNMDKALYFLNKYNINVSMVYDYVPDIFDLAYVGSNNNLSKKLINKEN